MANPKARREKPQRRGTGLRAKVASRVQRIEVELPPELRHYAKRMRQGLSRLEKQVASAQADARRRWARLLREASHQLGRIEALGEREWKKRTTRARRDAVKLLRRLEKAIEPRSVARPRQKVAKRALARTPRAQPRRKAQAVRASSLPAKAPASEVALVLPPTSF